MVGTFPLIVVRKMFLDDSCTQRHGAENCCMAWRMVGKPKHYGRKYRPIVFENPQVNVAKVFQTGGVIGVALHEHEL